MSDRNDRLSDTPSTPLSTSQREEKFTVNRFTTYPSHDGIMRKGDPGYDDYMQEVHKLREKPPAP